MSETGVKRIIARMITDDQFQKEFIANPKMVAERSGYALDENEVNALSQIKANDLVVQYNRVGVANAEVEFTVSGVKKFKNPTDAVKGKRVIK
jgi:hypothetical protein